jgi:hypothetical protein
MAVPSAVATQPPGEGVKRTVLASWVSSGPAPLVSDVAVYEDGTMVTHGIDLEGYQARLRRRDLLRLRHDLASSAFVSALGHLAGDDVLHRDDMETVSFNIGDRPEAGYEMCNDDPMELMGAEPKDAKLLDAAVVKLVGDLNAIGYSLFGKQLYRGLPLPSPCFGPRDAAKEPDPIPPGPPSRSMIEAAIAAAAAPKQLPRGVVKRMVQVLWLSTGREPLTNDVEVFEDGIVVIDGIGPGGRAAQLRRSDLIRLRDDLANSAFVSALGHMEAEGALYYVSGAQTVGFTVGSRPEAGYHVCSDKPADPAVAKFLGDLNTTGESLFGKRFNRLPLPSPCPAMPGPQDTPKKPDAPPP